MSTLSQSSFSEDESWCNKFILMLVAIQVVCLWRTVSLVTNGMSHDSSLLPSLAMLVVMIPAIIMMIYINYRNKVWHFFFRILLSGLVNMFILCMIGQFVGIAGAVVWIIAAVFVNRHRFKIFTNYKKYLTYIVATYALTFVFNMFFGVAILTHGVGPMTAVIAPFIPSILVLIWLCYLLKQEIKQGRSFWEATRILALMPMSCGYFFIGLLTLVPIKLFSGESLFGEEGHDYLAMPQE